MCPKGPGQFKLTLLIPFDSQGDPWDTQTDMLMALIGAICAQVMPGKMHDKQLVRS